MSSGIYRRMRMFRTQEFDEAGFFELFFEKNQKSRSPP
jgi:hypothetical protein